MEPNQPENLAINIIFLSFFNEHVLQIALNLLTIYSHEKIAFKIIRKVNSIECPKHN